MFHRSSFVGMRQTCASNRERVPVELQTKAHKQQAARTREYLRAKCVWVCVSAADSKPTSNAKDCGRCGDEIKCATPSCDCDKWAEFRWSMQRNQVLRFSHASLRRLHLFRRQLLPEAAAAQLLFWLYVCAMCVRLCKYETFSFDWISFVRKTNAKCEMRDPFRRSLLLCGLSVCILSFAIAIVKFSRVERQRW